MSLEVRFSPEVEKPKKCVWSSHTDLWFSPTAHEHFQINGLLAHALGDRCIMMQNRSPGCTRPGRTPQLCNPSALWYKGIHPSAYLSFPICQIRILCQMLSKPAPTPVLTDSGIFAYTLVRMKISSSPGRDVALGKPPQERASCHPFLGLLPSSQVRTGSLPSPLRVFWLPRELDPHRTD